MRSGFHQLPLALGHARSCSAFYGNTKQHGKALYQYSRMPYGSKNSVYEFQKVMDKVLREAGLTSCAWAYVDDVLIASETLEDHIKEVEAVLQALHNVGLRVHPGKSVFCSDKMEYLGHIVSPQGLEPQAAKVAAMASLPVPATTSILQSFMGLLNYYRCYIPDFSAIASALNKLLQKNVPFLWEAEQQQAFDTLKQRLCTEGLVLRQADPHRQYIVHTDWSQNGIGAVLAQLDDDGNEYMVACASRSLNTHERNYTPWKGELLAVVWGIKTFRVYLHGLPFEVVTDHRPLLWMLNQPEPTGQQARWVLSLMEYDFHVRHRPGAEHVNADILSRYPQLDQEDGTGAQLDTASDPVHARLPLVVFGPVGTGTPAEIPSDQIAIAPPHYPNTGRRALPAPAQPSGSNPAPPAQGGRKKMSRARYRKLHDSPYAALAQVEPYEAAISVMHLSTLAACGRAAYVRKQLTAVPNQAIDAYTLSAMELWELPYSQIADPELCCQVQPWAEELQDKLLQAATGWVTAAAPQVSTMVVPHPPRDQGSLTVTSVAPTFFPAAQVGLVVFEPFGGLCAGLEMVLRNRLPVHTCYYCDIDPTAQKVARHRLRRLQARYPGLLPPSALLSTFTALPQDVWAITTAQLQQLSTLHQRQWLVVGGWECQDLSPAGKGAGLKGPHSNTLVPLIKILADLQQCQHQLPPAYIVENTAMQFNLRYPDVATTQYELICQALGQPVCIDATQFDSLAHRVRNYWTNLCAPVLLQTAVLQVKRRQGLRVDTIIDKHTGRTVAPVTTDEVARNGRYPANFKGTARSAWPTFVSYKMSRGFLPGTDGTVWDPRLGNTEPNATEREQAMGYYRDDTAAPGLTDDQRREVLGRCIDSNVLQAIMAIAAAWHRRQANTVGYPEVIATNLEHCIDTEFSNITAATMVLAESPNITDGLHDCPCLEHYLVSMAVASAAEAQEGSNTDIWQDLEALHYLREQQYLPAWPPATRDRVKKRVTKYSFGLDGNLHRHFPDGSTRQVPIPSARPKLILEFHQRTGHFGIRRTGSLISTQYWWWGMWGDVATELSKCALCSRVRSSFNTDKPELQPLPISGLMYRWGVDLCGPFPTTDRGNNYVMVAVEHYSKHLELVPIPNKDPATTAAALASAVLGRYGSPAEILTDRGGEWMQEFEHLLLDCMIDHRHTSASHPAANGLAERCVQTTKRALSKLCAEEGSQVNWDLQLPWVMLGYNASTQQSTGLSPYQLMHAVTPTVPPGVRARLDQPINLDSPEAAAADFLARAKLVKERTIMAGDNLLIAQHRDTLRYAKLRSGNYTPQLKRYLAGDYVYVKKKDKEGLDIRAKQLILRVLEVRPTGVLILQGRCGTKRAVHITQCAPCHLPNIDPNIDWSLGRPDATALCQGCQEDDSLEKGRIVFCDNCNDGWHLGCHSPPLAKQPKGTWVCQGCVDQGITLEAVRALQLQTDLKAAQQLAPEKMYPSEMKDRALDGRLLKKQFAKPGVPNVTQWFTGRVHFRGRQPDGNLLVIYEDGDAEITTRWQLARDKVAWEPEGTVVPAHVSFQNPEDAESGIKNRIPIPSARHQPAMARNPINTEGPKPQATRRSNRLASKTKPAVAATAASTGSATDSSLPTDPVLMAATNFPLVGAVTVGTPTVALTDQLCLVTLPSVVQPVWPRYWDLTSPDGVQSTLQTLMPGTLARKDATRISNLIGETLTNAASSQPSFGCRFVPTDPLEVKALLSAINFAGCATFYDPFAGSGTIAKEFNTAGYSVRENDVNPAWGHPTTADALQPHSYQLPYDVIVTSPPFEVLDIAVPLLATKAAVAACIHVPGHWISNPRVARQLWLQKLAQQGRVHIVMGIPRGAGNTRCAWVIISPSILKLQPLLAHNQGPLLTFTYTACCLE